MTDKSGDRIDWGKVPNLFRRYIDLCKEEVNAKNTRGSSLKTESWEKIVGILKTEFKEIQWSQKAVKNKWDHLKKKTRIWYKLVGITGNTHYDPDTNTINWSTEQWNEYIKKNPEASQFRYKPLEYADDMRSLFDGMMAIGKDAWGPSKEGLPTDLNSPTINLDSESEGDPGSSAPTNKASSSQLKPEKMKEVKRVKREKSEKSSNLDNQLVAVLKTLEESDGPSLDECNKILDEMESLKMIDPLYIAAASNFCEGKAYREQWIQLSTKPEEVRKTWIAMNGKRMGLL